jgi:hypothetical protein
MRQAALRQSPALVVSLIALFVALGGTVYAAKKINGRSIRAKSIPGNRLKPRSVPANRLKPGVLKGLNASGPLTGADIDERTLGRVPTAAHAETADSAQSAVDAETALNAVNAIDAKTVNGHSAGCMPGTQPFAGACWESEPSPAATAPAAAATCATRGGALPEALQLAAFAELPSINLDPGSEWSGEIVSFTAQDAYAVATVTEAGAITSALVNGGGTSDTRKFRCVIPLVT